MKVVKKILEILIIAFVVFSLGIIHNEELQRDIINGVVDILIFIAVLISRFIIGPLSKFFFKQGIRSWATIAWKRIIIVGIPALFKRAMLNSFVLGFKNRVIKPLLVPAKRFIKHKIVQFKKLNLWKRIFLSILGILPAPVAIWLLGVGKIISLIFSKVGLAKILTGLLQFIIALWLVIKSTVMGFWNSFVKPIIDFIILFILIDVFERIPFIGKKLRKLRIVIKWKWKKWKLRQSIRNILKKHVDKRVEKVSEKIHKAATIQKKLNKKEEE